MIENLNFVFKTNYMEIFVQTIEMIVISLSVYFTNFKIINKKYECNLFGIINIIGVIFIALLTLYIKYKLNFFMGIVFLCLLIGMLFSLHRVDNSIVVTIISLAINYSILFCSVIIDFAFNVIVFISNDFINLIVILVVYIMLLRRILKMRKLKYGITFLKNNIQNEYMEILVLNVGIVVLASIMMLEYNSLNLIMRIIPVIIISVIALVITIQKILQIHYKQKMLIKELNEIKLELNKKDKEIKQLEQENLTFGKKSHSLAHKQKVLEYKINQLMLQAETSEEIDIRDRLNNISKELYNKVADVELTKTDIIEIDDMLEFMQSECIKNNIDFNLQINGNIYYMINNIISKEELEILIADHVKDAIIAIKHTNNINKSILVKLGQIEAGYELYIYDSGVEFEKETLENLGKKPSTTYADEGGTGIGFMNTFETLRKYKASLIISEIGKPSTENFTKVIMIKFDNKNEFKINSYK